MKPLALAAAALLALQGQPGLAQTNLAPPPQLPRPPEPPRPSEALVERFLASLPEDFMPGRPATIELDPESVERLFRLNPGKKSQIANILNAFEKCFQPAVGAAMERVNRTAAWSPNLGAEALERMTAFFGGRDWASYKAVTERMELSATPAPADLAERDRLLAAYPIVDLGLSLRLALLHAAHQGAFEAAGKCEVQRNAALAEAGIENPFGLMFGS